MNKNLKEKGITLVALVVTIIILLILSGITINLVVGQNGLLQRAQTASNTMANATANELKMFGEYETEINEVDNPSHGLTKVGSTTLSSANVSGNEALKAHYGEMTDFTSVGGVQWQLFYDDADYCYVIASDYVPNTVLPAELTRSTNNNKNNQKNYCAYFGTFSQNGQYTYAEGSLTGALANYSGASDIANNSFTQKYLKLPLQDAYKDSVMPNMLATAMMVDTSKWSNFTGKYGEFAIGGPTIEMFAKSYNAVDRHTTKLGEYDSINTEGSDKNVDQCGYMIKSGTGNWGGGAGIPGSQDMWYIADNEKANYMWVASPGAYNIGSMSSSNYGGNIAVNYYVSSTNAAFRPVVSILKSSIQ